MDINNDNRETLEFEPLANFYKGGRNVQICTTLYKNHNVQWKTISPFSPFKNSYDVVVVERIVPINSVIKNASISDVYYTEDGYGMPEFKNIDDALDYIDSL